MFIKTESGAILNWDAISRIVIEHHSIPGSSLLPTRRECKVVAYLAESNSPVVISSSDATTARQVMDAIEEAFTNSRTHPNLGSIFARRQLARELAQQKINE